MLPIQKEENPESPPLSKQKLFVIKMKDILDVF